MTRVVEGVTLSQEQNMEIIPGHVFLVRHNKHSRRRLTVYCGKVTLDPDLKVTNF